MTHKAPRLRRFVSIPSIATMSLFRLTAPAFASALTFVAAFATTIILNNGSYAILNIELMRVGVQNAGPKALSMLDLKNPAINWKDISEGMGLIGVTGLSAEGGFAP